MIKKVFVFFLFMILCLRSVFILAKEYDNKENIENDISLIVNSPGNILRIGIKDCILSALKNNESILIKRIEVKLEDGDVKKAASEFEPSFKIDSTLKDTTKLSSSALSGAALSQSRDIDFNAGISGKLITGTSYSLDFINEKFKSNSSFQSINPSYSTEPKITITQSILKNSGIFINTADIKIARNNKLQSKEVFKETVMDIVTKTKSAYYNFIFHQDNFYLAKLSLERAQDLLRINKSRYEKGMLSSVDLLETEAADAERKKAFLSAENLSSQAEDELKLITNLIDDPRLWNANIETVDKPVFIEENVNLIDTLKTAFKLRPDYRSARLDLKNRDIRIKVAKNAVFPILDLDGSFGLNGLGEDYDGARAKIDSDFKDWQIGVKFKLPWGTGERADYEQKKLEKGQAILSLKQLEERIILEVRAGARLVKMYYRQIDAARLSKEKESENYKAQKERYINGQISTHDILDYETRLDKAELDYIKALIDYNISLVNLDKASGLTLSKNDINLEE